MAKKNKINKTNAMRELDTADINYEVRTYNPEDYDAHHDLGFQIASSLGEDVESVFKTLVCVTDAGEHVVCCIPVAEELDLKAAAEAAGEKKLTLIPVKDLLKTTGYIRGGCTPVGMKKKFPTLIEETAQLFDRIVLSGGKPGYQLVLNPLELAEFIDAKFCEIVRS